MYNQLVRAKRENKSKRENIRERQRAREKREKERERERIKERREKKAAHAHDQGANDMGWSRATSGEDADLKLGKRGSVVGVGGGELMMKVEVKWRWWILVGREEEVGEEVVLGD